MKLPSLCFTLSLGIVAPAALAETTSRVLDEVSVPTQGAVSGGLIGEEGHYLFSSDEESTAGLWVTDGTTIGTSKINDDKVPATKVWAPPFFYFWIEKDLWRTDTTPGQATLVREDFGNPPDLEDGLLGSFQGALYWLDRVDGGWELWRSFGGPGDAALLASLPKGSAPVFAGMMVSDDDQLAFLAPDPDSRTTALWAIEDAENGPRLVDTDVRSDEKPFFCQRKLHYIKRLEGSDVLLREGSELRSGEEEPYRDPSAFLVEQDSVYFQAHDHVHGTELWRLLATEDQVYRLANIRAGNNSSSPEPLAVFGNKVLTMARGSGGRRLWQVPLSGSSLASEVDWLDEEIEDHYFHQAEVTAGFVYLISSATRNDGDLMLSKTDGTEDGMILLKDSWLTEREGYPHLYPNDDAVLFLSNQTAVGTEVYSWHPDRDLPVLVRDANTNPIPGARASVLQPVPGSTEIQYFTINRGNEHEYVRLGLDGKRTILRSDDVEDFGWSLTSSPVSGTSFFVDRNGLHSLLAGSSTPGLVYVNNTARPEINALHIPFTTTDGGILFLAFVGGAFHIMHSDGFVGGSTRILVERTTYQDVPIEYEGRRYFVPDAPGLSVQPWYVHGPGQIERFATFGSAVTIIGKTESHLYFSQGSTLWAYDDDERIVPAGTDAAVSPLVTPPTADSEDRLFYIGSDRKGEELWVTDGTEDGAERLTDIQDRGDTGAFAHLTTVNETLFFVADDGETGFELWMSDGTEDGTRRLTDLISGVDKDGEPFDSLPGEAAIPMMGAFGDYAYFAADDGVHGMELWRVHQSGSPVELFQDIMPGPGSSHPHNFITLNDRLFFQAIDPVHPLTTLREIVERQSLDLTIEISESALQFGEDASEPYLLMESHDLKQWKVRSAYTGEALGKPQMFPLPEVGDQQTVFYRLSPN